LRHTTDRRIEENPKYKAGMYTGVAKLKTRSFIVSDANIYL